MSRNLHMTIALMLIAIGGAAQGWMTYRWTANTAVADAVSRLDQIPMQVGDWTATDLRLTDNEVRVGRIDGYIKRAYVNQATGAQVHLLLMCGQAGPIALHPPTVCFSGQGYRVVGRQTQTSIADGNSTSVQQYEFHQADFGNAAIDDATLTRLYWAWSTDGAWESAANPRVDYAGEAVLFKLYVSEQWLPTGDTKDTGSGRLFMEQMLPVIRNALRSGSDVQEIPSDV